MNIPEHFICPISQDVMTDPVVDPFGISYERSEIVKWVNMYNTDPITRTRSLRVDQLVPNLALKASIEEYLKNNQPEPQRQKKQRLITPSEYQILVTPVIESFEDSTIITLKTSSGLDKLPVHILAVIDVSGSMGEEIEVKTTTGVERNGLSKLDITKHALNTIINSLSPNDTISLITFSTSAKLVAESVNVDQFGKIRLLNFVRNMQPDSQTNIWEGLLTALKCVERLGNSGKSTSIFLLTDGLPNMAPSRGHEHALSEELSKMTQKCTINTFGFGYQLDSNLLRNLSAIGSGLYSFIPDAGFVGTSFINALANQFLTAVISPTVKIHYADGTTSTHELSYTKLGIDRSIFIKRTKAIAKITISYTNALTQEMLTCDFLPNDVDNESEYDVVEAENGVSNLVISDGGETHKFNMLKAEHHIEQILNEGIRDDIIKLINRVITFGVCQQSNNDINTFISNYMDHTINQYIKNVIDDVTGQIRIALSNQEYFNKWGKHYLLSLAMSHNLQNCSNFKDPGLQLYSNQQFEQLRTQLDQVFLAIPVPVPTPTTRRTNPATTYTAPTSMRSYHNSNAPCFSGECTVQTEHGVIKVKDVKIGDKVLSSSNNFVKVTHILKTLLPKENNTTQVVTLDTGLVITTGHPIFVNDTWILPENLSAPTLLNENELYDFCVEYDHIILINGVACITLGHNLTGNNLIDHEYLGSPSVQRDIEHIGKIQKTPFYATIRPCDVIRDENMHIIGFTLWVD